MTRLAVPLAFWLRDFRNDASYKFSFVMQLGSVIVSVLIYSFMSRIFEGAATGYLQDYGNSYLAYVILGLALSDYMLLGVTAIGSRVREDQMNGTLELLMLSPSSLVTILISSSLWSYTSATLRLLAYLGLGWVLGMQLGAANVPVALAAFGLALISFNALGLLNASLVILLKMSNAGAWIVRLSAILLAGVFYPTEVLPGWLAAIAQLLPLTHAITLLRRSLLVGEGFAQLWPDFLWLGGLTLVLFPLGILACRFAVQFARVDGSLSHY